MVPMHFRAQVKSDIEADVKKGILERVPEGEHLVLQDGDLAQLEWQGKKNSGPVLPQQAWT